MNFWQPEKETSVIDPVEIVTSDWTRVGCGFNAQPSAETPDIERLVLETARVMPQMSRLLIMGATWLHLYGDAVARHRLARLISEELEPEHHPTIGLFLDIAQQGTHPHWFEAITRELPPVVTPRALFDVYRELGLTARALQSASEISLRWGLWCEPVGWKMNAMRPAWWIMQHNPSLLTRADFRGDLRASVLGSLRHDAESGGSELSLARACGGSRAQVRAALDNLEMTGRVKRSRVKGSRATRITLTKSE